MDQKVALTIISRNKRSSDLLSGQIVDDYVAHLSLLLHYRNRGRVRKLAKTYASFLNKISKCMGPDTACSTGKQLANIMKRLALELSADYTYPIPIKTDEHNLPTKLKPFRRFLFSKNAVLKGVALSISNMYRTVEIDAKASYADVINPIGDCESVELVQSYISYLTNDWSEYLKEHKGLGARVSEKRPISPSTLYSRSPSGERSIDSAHLCALSLMHPENKIYADSVFSLYSYFNRDFEVVNLVSMSDIMERSIADDVGRSREWTSRGEAARYVFIPDKGGKTRGITLANYFIQDSLKPIHDDFMSCLRLLKRDFTYKQNKVPDVVNEMFVKGKLGYCYDMTGATDRFPRFFQVFLISAIYGSSVSDAWNNLMGMKIHHKHNVLQFSVGQPMGLYSSFCAFSLCHHALVHFAAKCVGIRKHVTFSDYMILGDDVVIFHEEVASMYEYLLTKVLAVKVSKHKSILSKEFMVVEFCKRLFLKDKEISPLGSGVLSPKRLDVKGLTEILEHFYDWSVGGIAEDSLVYNYISKYIIRLLGKRAKDTPYLVRVICLYLITDDKTSSRLRACIVNQLGLSYVELDKLRRSYQDRLLEKKMDYYADDRYVESRMRGQAWSRRIHSIPFGMSHTSNRPIEEQIGNLETHLLYSRSDRRPSCYKKLKYLFEKIELLDNTLTGMQNSRKRNANGTQEYERQRILKKLKILVAVILDLYPGLLHTKRCWSKRTMIKGDRKLLAT